MSVRLRERRYEKLSGGNGKKPAGITILGVLFALGLVFFLIYPPIGLVWCFAVGKPFLKELLNQGIIKKNVEGKYNVDWNKAKATSQRSFDQVRTYSKDTAQQYKQRISESHIMEEKQPYRHPHTPVNYSYDKCAQDRRLEQLKSLKDAGILDEAEYRQRRQKILAGK